VTKPRLSAAGLLLVGIALLASACVSTKNPEGWASPSLDGSTAYFFSEDDTLSAVNLDGGPPAPIIWQFPDASKPAQKDAKFKNVYSEPVLDGDALYFASYDGRAFSVGAKDGQLRWQLKDSISGSVVGGPTLAGNFLAFGTTEGRLYVVDKATGAPAPNWPKAGMDLGEAIWAAPVAQGNTLFVATMGGKLFAFDLADGSRKWDQPYNAGGAIPDLALADATHLFVPTLKNSVAFVDVVSGKSPVGRLTADDWVWMRPVSKDGVAYFGDFSGNVYALDITSGRQIWKASPSDSKVKSSPVIVDDVLVVATRKPAILFINLKDGSLIHSVDIPDKSAGTVRAPLLVYNGKVLIETTGRKLFLADPKTRSVQPLPVTEKP
jgi:outer membrane protein assembly factor BamB